MSTTTNKLVIDIETIGEDFDALDHATQENLTRWIKRDSESDEGYKMALEDLKNGLGFSPLTGEIVAIGLLDYYKNEGGVYYQAPGQKNEEVKENGISFKQMTEEEMLRKFWELAERYQRARVRHPVHGHPVRHQGYPTDQRPHARTLSLSEQSRGSSYRPRGTIELLRCHAAKGESASLLSRIRH
jgi:hypothetical protein